MRGHQPRGRHQGQRPGHPPGSGRGNGRRAVLGSIIESPAIESSRMKRAYTDEHAAAGTRAPLPEIETWPNQYRDTEIEIVMPEFTSVCPKTGLPHFGGSE